MDGIPELPDITDTALAAHLQRLLDHKTKPLGALGSIELLARRMGEIFGTAAPTLAQPQLVVFAADHGLVAQGVSAYPQDVTCQMVRNFLAGGAAANVLARQHGLALTVVDCGVAQPMDLAPYLVPRALHPLGPRLLQRSLGRGTADASLQAAMTPQQCQQAIAQGRALLSDLPGNALLLGEMGIGNTSAASLLLARLSGLDIAYCTGTGTGLDAAALMHKTRVLRAVLQRHADAAAPLEALAAFGGFEIATMVGAVLQAALERRLVVVDGFIATSAVLVAHALQPRVLQRCIFAHRSGERGHASMLAWLEAEPLLDLGLRLGEGSGAALAWPLLQSACLLLSEMASFEAAGVSRSTQAACGAEA